MTIEYLKTEKCHSSEDDNNDDELSIFSFFFFVHEMRATSSPILSARV